MISLRLRSLLVLSFLFAAAMGYWEFAIFLPGVQVRHVAQGLGGGYSFGNDFYPIWLASREWMIHGREPYSQEMTQAIQSGLFGRPLDPNHPGDPPPDYRVLAYPAFVLILAAPLAALPFPVTRLLLAVLLPLATGTSIVLWVRALRFKAGASLLALLVVLTLSSYAGLEALFAEQPGLVVSFLLAASLFALTRGARMTAGLLLALTLIKPQMTALVVLYLLLWSLAKWRERSRFLFAFSGGAAALCLCGLLVSPHWLSQWLHVVLGYKAYSTPALTIDLLGHSLGIAAMVCLLTVALALAWRMRNAAATSAEFLLTVSFLLAVTAVALLPGHAVYDHVILLPGIILILRFRREVTSSKGLRVVLILAAAALFWQWLAALAIVGLHLLLGPQRPLAATALLLPIRTAGAIPFAILALLGLVLRDFVRGSLKLDPQTS